MPIVGAMIAAIIMPSFRPSLPAEVPLLYRAYGVATVDYELGETNM